MLIEITNANGSKTFTTAKKISVNSQGTVYFIQNDDIVIESAIDSSTRITIVDDSNHRYDIIIPEDKPVEPEANEERNEAYIKKEDFPYSPSTVTPYIKKEDFPYSPSDVDPYRPRFKHNPYWLHFTS